MALPAASQDPVTLFKAKLRSRDIQPTDEVMVRLIVHYSTPMALAASPTAPAEAAVKLYWAASDMPGNRTCRYLADECKLSLGGPIKPDFPHILQGVDLISGTPSVVKVLPWHQLEDRVAAQLRAVDVLGLTDTSVPLVQTKVMDFTVPLEAGAMQTPGMGSRSRKLLLMPWFAGSLDDWQLNAQLIERGVMRVVDALEYMHGKMMAHLNIQASNIFIAETGQWFLGDFGTSRMFDEDVPSNIRTLYPGPLPPKASAVIDWRQLVVTIAVLLNKADQQAMQQDGVYDPAKVKQRCDECRELQHIMPNLYAKAEWEQLQTD